MLSAKAYYNLLPQGVGGRFNVNFGRKSLLGKTASLWMENVINVGGGERDSDGKVTLNTLPKIEDKTSVRDDTIESNRGAWLFWAKREHKYHGEFNEKGATVRNLYGTEFKIYGDGKLSDMPSESLKAIQGAVQASVQALFQAYNVLKEEDEENVEKKMEELGGAKSDYFDALKYIPVYVVSDGNNYFDGKWAPYAKAVDSYTEGANIITPKSWEDCQTPYLYGKDWGWPDEQPSKCTVFPAVAQKSDSKADDSDSKAGDSKPPSQGSKPLWHWTGQKKNNPWKNMGNFKSQLTVSVTPLAVVEWQCKAESS